MDLVPPFAERQAFFIGLKYIHYRPRHLIRTTQGHLSFEKTTFNINTMEMRYNDVMVTYTADFSASHNARLLMISLHFVDKEFRCHGFDDPTT
jgi:hypothetical protein